MAQDWLRENFSNWSLRTVRRKSTALKSWAKWAGNPNFLSHYRVPKAAPLRPHPIPEGMAGIRAMLDASQQEANLHALVALCGLCGLRVSEARSVRPSDFDTTSQLLTIFGKGKKQRTIPVSSLAMDAILPAFRVAARDNRLIIQMSDSGARAKISDLAERAGVSVHVASHDLRATFATEAYNASRDIRAVQHLLGHSSVETTTGYIDANMRSMRGAVDALARDQTNSDEDEE